MVEERRFEDFLRRQGIKKDKFRYPALRARPSDEGDKKEDDVRCKKCLRRRFFDTMWEMANTFLNVISYAVNVEATMMELSPDIIEDDLRQYLDGLLLPLKMECNTAFSKAKEFILEMSEGYGLDGY